MAVLQAIASVEGKSLRGLDFTLYDHVNVEALEHFANQDREPWTLKFQVPGHYVTARHDRTIVVDGSEIDIERRE